MGRSPGLTGVGGGVPKIGTFRNRKVNEFRDNLKLDFPKVGAVRKVMDQSLDHPAGDQSFTAEFLGRILPEA